MLPEPLATKPIAISELVQLKVSPPPVFAVKAIGPIISPGHTIILVTAATTGAG